MDKTRIVTPQEAHQVLHDRRLVVPSLHALLSTVATEPERIAAAERAAVVKALDELGDDYTPAFYRAREIENGAPL